jgi:hypothetical protein
MLGTLLAADVGTVVAVDPEPVDTDALTETSALPAGDLQFNPESMIPKTVKTILLLNSIPMLQVEIALVSEQIMIDLASDVYQPSDEEGHGVLVFSVWCGRKVSLSGFEAL